MKIRKLTAMLLVSLLFATTSAFAVGDLASQTKNEDGFDYSQKEYNFEDNSQYISDEQLQDAKEIDVIDNNTSFWSKIINSSFFTPNTATKTYIPINKVQ